MHRGHWRCPVRHYRALASVAVGNQRGERLVAWPASRRICSQPSKSISGIHASFSPICGLNLRTPTIRKSPLAYHGAEPVLLAETSTINDYSLMERPVRDPSEAATDVDPREAAVQIRGLLERYLDLQPHERSNLSIMLYNCDAAGLPLRDSQCARFRP